MFYANTFTLKMENKKMAAKALEVMREALAQIDADGFKYDSRKTVDDFANDLMVKGSEVIAAGNCGLMPDANHIAIQMSAVFAELELSIIRARVKSGMANAKKKGRRIGRPHTTKDDIPAIFYKHYPSYAAHQMNVSELARICGLSRPTVYKYLKMIA